MNALILLILGIFAIVLWKVARMNKFDWLGGLVVLLALGVLALGMAHISGAL